MAIDIKRFATEAIGEKVFVDLLGGLWKGATGAITGVAKEKFEAALSSKGMKDNALAVESFGIGLADPSEEELKQFLDALKKAGSEKKKYLENIILVLAWPIQESGAKEKEEKAKEDDNGKKISGILRSSPDLKKKKEKAKYSGRIRALCSGAKSADEVYERMLAFGLLDEAPDGAIEKFLVYLKKQSPEASTSIKIFLGSIKTGTANGIKNFAKGFINPFSIFKK